MISNRHTHFSTKALTIGALLFLAPIGAMAVDTKTGLKEDDRDFIQEESAAGVALVRIAELAVKQAERAEVKTFAQTIATEQSKANAELATLARSKGLELDSDVDSKYDDSYEDLRDERGREFDEEFLELIVDGHEECIDNFEDVAEDASDNEVKQWATKMLPTLRANLKKAERLSSDPRAKAADNTARNVRDRDDNSATSFDQGNSKADRNTTAQIRKEILNLKGISMNAKNVKIITNEGRVTLRGPVDSEEEKRNIGQIANQNATSGLVDNQLEVKGSENAI